MTPATNIILKLNSWSEFEGSLCTLSRKEKGDAFEELTRLHLLSDPIFTTKLQHVWHHTDIPQRVIDELGLMQPEIGVDLVAQTRDGDYWAIQCKFHQDPTVNVGYGELKSFFGITERRQTYGRLSHRLICTSANGVSDNVTKAHPDKLGYLTSAEFSALGPEQFSAFHSLIEGERPTLVAYSPMSHQKTAIAKARDHFIAGRNSRGKLIHPCGTGKSLTGYWIAETLGARQVLIAVPSLFLVRQTLSVWAREAVASGHDMEWLAVCSDEDVSKSDDPAMRRSELGIDVTTDTKIVSAFLKKPSATTKVVITTYQSGHVTSAGANAANAKFDLGIFDEAHKTVGAADTLFSHLLSDKNVSVDRRIFMTATERQYRGNSDDVLSMDDREMYGDTFDLLSFKAALELDPPILCDYRIVSIVVTKSEIEQLIANQTMIRSDGKEWSLEGDARMLAAMIALRKTIKKHGIHHCISFHRSIERSKQFAHLNTEATKADQELDRLSCFHVSGKDKTGKRKQELDRFVDASPSLITNARCLTEGVDVPAIDAILFADPRQSKIDIVQAAGRAMRKFKGKELGYILVPVTIDEELDDPSDAAFEQIINVLSALATQDERIVEEFTTMATSNWAHKSSLIEVDIPDYVRVNFSDFLRDVEIRIWDRLGRGWPRGFERLQAYVDREGHARVLLNYKDETGFKLGSWVATRRTEYNRGDLTSDRIEALDALPGWVWDPLEKQFQEGLQHMRAYMAQTGRARVPNNYKDETGFNLGSWATSRRMEHRQGNLTSDRIEELAALPGWVWDGVEAQFEEGLQQLRAYVEREGHARVQATYKDKTGFNLGGWVRYQRTEFQKENLSIERIEVMSSLPGWDWDPYENDFNDGLERLRVYVAREGHARVPQGYKDETSFWLGRWVAKRRGENTKNLLSAERIEELSNLPGWVWDPYENDFNYGLERLRVYVAREGHARVPFTYKDDTGFNLGSWVRSRRKQYLEDTLSPERIETLVELPGWVWDVIEAQFEEGLQQLRAYVEREGHARVHKDYTDEMNFSLGSWVDRQRYRFKNDKLSPERIKVLENFPGWIWAPRETNFENGLARLKSYLARERDVKVPSHYKDEKGFSLGGWVENQRSRFKKDKLPPERIKALEELSGWVWDPIEQQYQEGLQRMQVFVALEGHARAPQRYKDETGYKLGNWVNRQRSAYKKDGLLAERIKTLESLPGWTWGKSRRES